RKEVHMNAMVKQSIQGTPKSQNRSVTGPRKAPHSAFKPGVSGNPGGRPKLTPQQKAEEFELMEAFRSHSSAALDVIGILMRSADRDSVKLAAASFIIERGWGKAMQPVMGEHGGPIQHIVTVEVVD
ncbi:MAG: DUF5681 domain-containing protein, partial [Nitrospirota bacterium]